ncbi:Gfo/Idh/MocA family oxidoreductase [soil metagenome]
MSESRSRRDFLRTAAAAAAAAGLAGAGERVEAGFDESLPVPQAPKRAPLADDEVVRMAVIGTGGMGTAHCDAIVKLVADKKTNARIEALADVCQPRLANAKERVDRVQGGDAQTYTDYRQVLARDDIHGVLIASPEHWHAKMGEDAIKAGKDVYVEKPMTLNLKDALRLRKVVQANPHIMFAVGTQYVLTPSYAAAQKLIADGVIGKPVWSQTSFCRNSKAGEWTYYKIDPEWEPGVNLDWKQWCGPSGKAAWSPEIYARWRRYRKYSTGIVGDLLVHQITPMIMAMNLGWPTRVAATGGHYVDKAMENHDQVNVTIQFGEDHTMVVAGSTCNELGFERVIRGHKGNIFVGGRNAQLRPEQIYAEEVEEREIPAPPGAERDDQNALRLHWLQSIRTRQAPVSNVELGTKVMVIVDLATRSLWEGSAFEYDPARQRVRKA